MQNKPFIVDIDISFLSSSLSSTYPFHSFNHRSLPWPLVLVTRSPTLDILLPTHRCHNNTLNSINNAGVTMMQNQTIATHMVREIQAQHILPPTLTTTTLVNSANSTPAVSITPHSLFICSRLQSLSCSPLTVKISRSTMSTSLRHRGLGYFHSNFTPLRNAYLIVLTFGHRLRGWLRTFCHISHERGNAAWTNKLCRSLSSLVCREANSHLLRGD